MAKALPDLSRCPVIACDAETTGLAWWKQAEIFGLAFAWPNGNKVDSVYVDVRNSNERRWAADQLKRAKRIVNHNSKFDMHQLRESDLPQRFIECTMIREALLDEHRYEYSLDSVSKDYGFEGKADIWAELAAMFGGKPTRDAQILNLQFAPEPLVAKYARPDAEMALRVWLKQEDAMIKQDLRQIVDFEHRLLKVVLDMERRGVRVDLERAAIASKELGKQTWLDQKELNKLAGWEVNVNSGPQVIKIVKPYKDDNGLWHAKDGLPLEKTDGGGPSIRTHALHNMGFREAELIASIRGMIKAKDVFIDRYVLGDSHNGYIHCNINQTKTEAEAGTTTGRFSITEPALQQIHARDVKLARIVRSLFLADPGQKWGSYDLDQVDFRCFVHYVNEPRLLAAYEADPRMDYHGYIAEMFNIPRDRNEKTGGANAKQIDLALIFGMGQGRLCSEMGLPYTVDEKGYFRAGEEGEAFFAKYHRAIPGVRKLTNGVESVAKKRGYILTPLKRRLHFPHGRGAHKAAGLLFQAACADIIKLKMIEVHDMLEGTDSRLMLTVHDELCLSMGKDVTSAQIIELIERFDGIKTPMKFRVPILCKGRVADDWFESTKKIKSPVGEAA